MVKIVIEGLTPQAREVIRKNNQAYFDAIRKVMETTKVIIGNNENYTLDRSEFAVNFTT